MRARFVKRCGPTDAVDVLRDDGTMDRSEFPKDETLPHDAIHLVVEHALGMRHALWGHVEAGLSISRVEELVKTGGQPGALHSEASMPAIVELVQAERLVECFEAELRGGSAGPRVFRSAVRIACLHSRVPPVDATDAQFEGIRHRLEGLRNRWAELAVEDSIELDWS